MSKKRLLWFQFFPRDWISDSDLRRCSVAARGVWIDLLCLMTQGKDYGKLVDGAGNKLSNSDLASDCRVAESELVKFIDELKARNVFSVDENGVIYSRKMIRDESIRRKNTENGKKGGSPIFKTNTLESIDNRLESGLTESVNPTVNHATSGNLSINNPTLEDCMKASATIGMRKEDVEACFHYYSAQGWKSGKGVPLVNLSSVLARWKSISSTFKKPEVKQENETPKWKKLEILKEHVSKFTAQNPHPDRWTQEQRDTLKKNREEIKKLEMEMVK